MLIKKWLEKNSACYGEGKEIYLKKFTRYLQKKSDNLSKIILNDVILAMAEGVELVSIDVFEPYFDEDEIIN